MAVYIHNFPSNGYGHDISHIDDVLRILPSFQPWLFQRPGPTGAFAVYKGEEPAVTGNIRLRLSTVDNGTPLVAHLSAMVVKHGALLQWVGEKDGKLNQHFGNF